MMIEQNTNYAYKMKHMDNPTFDKVRDLSTKFYRELPKALQEELYETLNHGVDILDSEPQMTTYMYAFGMMHQAKLNYAFGKLPYEFYKQSEINIIDYGCGQAMGTMCYADFLRENGVEQNVKTITLIEPSETCLKRAALHASVFFPDAEIITVNKKFDDLKDGGIVCYEETPTLHILSNVLDMLSFDLDSFSSLVKGSLKGYNQFVCVGPYFNYSNKDKRMKDFCLKLNGREYCAESFDRYGFEEDKTWTAQIFCFTIGKRRSFVKKETGEDVKLNDGHEIKILSRNEMSLRSAIISAKAPLNLYANEDGTKHAFTIGALKGYASDAAAKAVADGIATVDNLKVAECSVDGGKTFVPCLMVANINNLVNTPTYDDSDEDD